MHLRVKHDKIIILFMWGKNHKLAFAVSKISTQFQNWSIKMRNKKQKQLSKNAFSKNCKPKTAKLSDDPLVLWSRRLKVATIEENQMSSHIAPLY